MRSETNDPHDSTCIWKTQGKWVLSLLSLLRSFISTALLWSCCKDKRILDNTQDLFMLDRTRHSRDTHQGYLQVLRSLRTHSKPKSFFEALETASKFQQLQKRHFTWVPVKSFSADEYSSIYWVMPNETCLTSWIKEYKCPDFHSASCPFTICHHFNVNKRHPSS